MKKMSLSEKWRNLSPADKRELKNAALIFENKPGAVPRSPRKNRGKSRQ